MDRNFSSDIALGFAYLELTQISMKKYSALHESWLPHIVSTANPKSPASLDYDTQTLFMQSTT